MMRRRPAAEIDGIQKRLTAQALSSLAEDPDANITDLVRRIEDLKKLKSAAPANLTKRLLPPLCVGAICLAALAVALVLRIDTLGLRTPLVLNATAQSVSFVADSDWMQKGQISLADGHFRSDRFAVSFSDPTKAFGDLQAEQWLEGRGGNLALSALSIRKGSQATIETSENADVAIYGTGLGGEIYANGRSTLRWSEPDGEARTKNLDLEGQPPEIFSFAPAGDGASARLAFFPKAAPMTMRDLSIAALTFGQEMQVVPGDSRFASTILAGSLRLPSIGKDTDLSKDRAIAFIGLAGRIDSLVVDHKISLLFVGDTKKIFLGSGSSRSDITPSILVYLYRNQIVAFLFASFTFAWGALWSLTRLISA